MSRPITIIPSGNVTLSSTQSKFNGTSAYFDGLGDRLTVNDPTLVLGTGNFTTEFWFYPITGGRVNSGQIYQRLWQSGPNAENGLVAITIENDTNPAQLSVYIYTGGAYQRIILASSTAANDTWHHVALTRSSGTYTLWLNGVSVGTNNSYTTYSQPYSFVNYGTANQNNIESFYGYMDELRISNTARYSSSFTPSSTAFTNDANTLFLCHCDGTPGTNIVLDDNGSRFQHRLTAFNGAKVSTSEKKFGTGSIVLDGTNDYVQSSSSTDFGFGTGDFTLEAWVYRTESRFQVVISARDLSVYANVLVITAGNLLGWSNGSVIVESTGTVPINTWTHVAASRSSGTLRMFLNGTQVFSGTQSLNVGTVARPITIGAFDDVAAPFKGYIDEVRVSNIARYTTGFTPSSSAFTNDSNTRLLVHADGENQSTVFVDDNGLTALVPVLTPRRAKDVAVFGNAQVSTAQSKFGGASYQGTASTNNHLDVSHFGDLNLGTSDFTVECWFRVTTVSPQYQCIYDSREQQDFGHTFEINYSTLKFVRGYTALITHGTAIETNRWYHVAVTRSGTTLRLFVDGVLSGSATNSDNLISTNPFRIGTSFNYDAGLIGNIDEFRISNTARYTSSFTPATAAFVNDANTLLLLHMDGTNGSTVFVDDWQEPAGTTQQGEANLTSTVSISATANKFKGTRIDMGYYIDPGYIDADYYYENPIKATINAELTEKQGVLVEASGAFNSTFTQSSTIQRNRFGQSTLSSQATVNSSASRTRSGSTAQASQFNIFALGSKSTDIDLVAFNQSSLSISGNRIRFGASAQTSSATIEIAVGGVQTFDADLTAAFTQTAIAGKIMTLESAMSFDFAPNITVNAVRVVAMLAEIISALNNDPSRFRNVDVTLENIINISSQSDRIREFDSQQQSQADLSATANQTKTLSSTLSASSSLFAIISHIEGADMVAFGDSTLSAEPNVIKGYASEQNSNFTVSSTAFRVQQAESNQQTAFTVSATVRRPSRYVGVPTITSGGQNGTLTFDSSTRKFISSVRYDAFEGWGVPRSNIVWTGTEYVMVTFLGVSPQTYKSANGITWFKYTNNLVQSVTNGCRLFYTNSKFYIFQTSSTAGGTLAGFESSDAITWSSINLGTGIGTGLGSNYHVSSFFYNANRNRYYMTYVIRRTADDIRTVGLVSSLGSPSNWSGGNFGSSTNLREITDATMNNFWHVGVSNAPSTTAGQIYVQHPTNPGLSSAARTPTGQTGFNSIAHNSSTNAVVIVGDGGIIFRSTSNIIFEGGPTQASDYLNTFSSQTSPTTTDLLGIEFANGQFLACGKNGTVITSTTGASNTWTQRTTGVTHDLFGKPKYVGSNTWIIEYATSYDLANTQPLGYIKSTDNGVTWSDFTFSTQYSSAKISYPDHPGYAQWKTIDFWAQTSQITFSNSFRIGQGTDWYIQLNLGNTSGSQPFFYANGATQVSSGTNFAAHGQFNHYRVAYNGNVISLYINGQRVGTANVSGLNFASAEPLTFAYTTNQQYYNTFIDEFLITDDLLVDPTQTSFSVPQSEYTNDYDTRLLLHFNGTYEDDASELPRLRIADAALSTAFSQSAAVNRIRDTGSTENSEFTIFALGSRSTDIDLVAFGNASLTADFDNFRPFDALLSSEFAQVSSLDGVKPFDAALSSNSTINLIPSVTRTVSIDTDAIATQLTVAAKTGNTLVTIITTATQTADAVKTVDVDSQQFVSTEIFARGYNLVSGDVHVNSEFSQYSDLRRFRDYDSLESAAFTQVTDADVTRSAESQMSVTTTTEASPAGSRIGINAVLSSEFAQTADVEKLKIVDASLSSTFTQTAQGDRTRLAVVDLDSEFTKTATATRIKQLDIETDSIATQLTAVAKIGNTLVTIITAATQTTTATKNAVVSLDLTAAFTDSANVQRFRDVDSEQSAAFTQTTQEDLFKAFDSEMSSTFTLQGQAEVTATIALIAFTDTALAVEGLRIRPGSADLDTEFTDSVQVKVTRTTGSELDSNFSQRAILSGNFFGTSNQTAVFGITANTAVLHITQYVYKIPAENRVHKIVEETRFKAINGETRLYNIGRQ